MAAGAVVDEVAGEAVGEVVVGVADEAVVEVVGGVADEAADAAADAGLLAMMVAEKGVGEAVRVTTIRMGMAKVAERMAARQPSPTCRWLCDQTHSHVS